ncbi:MAG: TonB-dependent receptor, partial [Pseudomonadota bacterium]
MSRTTKDKAVTSRSVGKGRSHLTYPCLAALAFGFSSQSAIANDDDALIVAQASQTYEFAIPPQSLSSALDRFTDRTSIAFAANSEALQGNRTKGVAGTYAAEDALRQLLIGTGISYRFAGPRSVVLEQIANEDDSSNGPVVLNQIVVSGERVDRSVFDTASSVNVQTGENLERDRGRDDLRTVLNSIPNVFDEVGTNNAPAIRGLDSTGPSTGSGAFFGGARPRASIVVDGRAISSLEMSFSEISVWDAAQVEAFNGPQTTSNGTNSLAGAIFLNTQDPIHEFEAKIRGFGGSRENISGAGMINMPLIQDQLALRGTFEFERQDTWRDAIAVPPDDNLDREQRLTGRVKLLFEPEFLEDLSTKLTLSYNEDTGPQTFLSDPPHSRRESTSNEASFNNEVFSLVHETVYEFTPGLTVTNLFTFADTATDRTDAGAAEGLVLNGDEVGNEARINFEGMDGRLTGVFGGAWLKRSEDTRLEAFGTAIPIDGVNESFGVFGEATYSATEQLHVTLGGRFQFDNSQRNLPAVPQVGFLEPTNFDEDFSEFLPKASIAYDVTPDLRIGALVAKGYNPGGISEVLGAGVFEYGEEKLWTFEVFTRASFFDNRVQVGANAFYNRVEDYQIFTTVPILVFGQPQGKIENADLVESFGLDLSAEAFVFDDLRVDVALGLLHTEIEEFD